MPSVGPARCRRRSARRARAAARSAGRAGTSGRVRCDPNRTDTQGSGFEPCALATRYSCRTTQSATVFGLALRSSASSARSMAANASIDRSRSNAGASASSAGIRSTLATAARSAFAATRLHVAQQRGNRVQVIAERVPLAGARAAALADDFPRRLEPIAGIAGVGHALEHALRGRRDTPRHPSRARRSRAAARLPRAMAATARASPLQGLRASSTTGRRRTTSSGAKRTAGQRERTVSSSRPGCAVTRISTEPGGGSSSVFSSAFCASSPSSPRRRRSPRGGGLRTA